MLSWLFTMAMVSAIPEQQVAEAAGREECPDCLMGNLNWLLTQAHYALASELAAAFEPLGITPRGHSVLGAGDDGAHTQKQLAELVGLDKTTMVVTLDELEAAGLARRVPSPSDRRAHVIEVTAPASARSPRPTRSQSASRPMCSASLGTPTAPSCSTDARPARRERLAEPAACKSVRRREPRAS